MNNKIITAVFTPDTATTRVLSGVWQWDYGQVLRIQGLHLKPAIQVHFAHEGDTEAITRIGITKDGVTEAPIPDSILTQSGTFYAYVFVSDATSGSTEYRITLSVRERAQPEEFETPEEAELFRAAIDSVNESSAKAENAAKESEAWAHGHEEFPDRVKDNAAFYAGQAKDTAAEVPGKVKEAKRQIDEYIEEKEAELKGDTGNLFFAAFRVVGGRLKAYSDPNVDKVRFVRHGSRLSYRLTF